MVAAGRASRSRQRHVRPRSAAQDSDPEQARQWYERAAQAGHADAMFILGVLLEDSDREQARNGGSRPRRPVTPAPCSTWGCCSRTVSRNRPGRGISRPGHAGSRRGRCILGVLLDDSDPEQARQWYERAAQAGYAGAVSTSGVLLGGRSLTGAGPGGGYEQAGHADNAGAMLNLGVLVKDGPAPEQAREWWQRATQTVGGAVSAWGCWSRTVTRSRPVNGGCGPRKPGHSDAMSAPRSAAQGR